MTDTSTDAVKRTRRKLILYGYSKSADFLRALADYCKKPAVDLPSTQKPRSVEAPSGVTPR